MNAARYNVPLATLLALCAQFAPPCEAQIYTCTGKDGTRIFSDERCGPDAKIVPNIGAQKPAKKAATPPPSVAPKSTDELEGLLKRCNDGDMTACTTWTRAGGPNSLRERERKTERSCDAGSLVDCEDRYCNGGVSDECRTRVLQTAKVAGDNWYLRDTGKPRPDGSTVYDVRCIPIGARTMRDLTVTCNAQAGPARCSSVGAPASYARLDVAAAQLCVAK